MSKPIVFPFDVDLFFKKCIENKHIPKNDFEKQAILIKLIENFEDKRRYTEQEVNKIIEKYFEDYTWLRRELINFGYMQRNSYSGEYWVVKRVLTQEDIRNNTMLRRHAKPFKVLDEDR